MRNTSRFCNPFLGEDNKAKPKNFAYAGVSVLRMLVQRHGLAWQSYGSSLAAALLAARVVAQRFDRYPGGARGTLAPRGRDRGGSLQLRPGRQWRGTDVVRRFDVPGAHRPG